MKLKKIFPLLGAALLLCSCEKVIDFDPGDIEPYVVMVARPQADSTVSVYLSYSRFFLNGANTDNQIEDGAVTLEVNGVPTTGTYVETVNGSGRYLVNIRPQAGDSLRLTALVPGYDQLVTAATRVPSSPQFEVTDFVIDTSESTYYEWDSTWHKDYVYFKIKMKMKGCSPKDCFSVSLLASSFYTYNPDGTPSSEWDTAENRMQLVNFTVNDPIVNTQDLENVLDGYDGRFNGNQMTFSAEDFVDGEHEFTIEFNEYCGYETFNKDFSKMPILLKVRGLSWDLYLYDKTTSAQSELDEIFGEPVQVHSNIEGGIGIFGAMSDKKERLCNPRFEQFNHDGGYYYKKK